MASLIQERRLSDKIVEERLRFDALGMEYEVWGPRQFLNKLRHQRGIVTQYMGNYWANVICGDVPVGAIPLPWITAQSLACSQLRWRH